MAAVSLSNNMQYAVKKLVAEDWPLAMQSLSNADQ